MPATADPPTTTTTTPAPDTGIAHGAPSTGAAPSSFRPPNPAFEASKARMMERWGQKPPPRKPEPVQVEPEKSEPSKTNETTKSEIGKETTGTNDQHGATGDGEGVQSEGEQDDSSVSREEHTETIVSSEKKDKKLSPWRVIDDYKKTTAELKAKVEGYEKEIATLKSFKPAEVPKEIQERLTAAEAKIKEYEDDIRFTNYRKHPEYIEKYWKPYEAEFSKTMHKLEGIPVNLPDGSTRPIDAKDILNLLMMNAADAETKAREAFGDYGGTVIRRVEKLQDLFDAQNMALEDAKKNGAEREKQWREQRETEQRQVGELINNTWSAERRAATTDPKHGKYFTPVEGDQKGNAALAKGLEFADKTFKLNPMEPGISNEERQDRVKRHVAAFYRQAAYPRMRQWLEEARAENEELKKQLDEYAESEPGQSGGTSKPAPAAPKPGENFFSGFAEKLRKKAR